VKEEDSFLKMIGLEESDPDVSDISFHEDELNEASSAPAVDEESHTDEVIADDDLQSDRDEVLSDYEAEATEKDFGGGDHRHTELFDTGEKPFEPNDLYASATEEASIEEVTNARASFAVSDPSDEPSKTGIFTDEDRLLEGLEEAEYSRATDVFAPKARDDADAEARRTQAILGALDDMNNDDSGELAELLTEESVGETKSVVYEEEIPLEDIELDPAEAEAEVDQPEESSPSGFETIVGESAQEGSRQTLAFQYQDDLDAYGRLCVVEGPTNLDEVLLQEFPIRIGRDPENDLVLEDVNSSRFHAEIVDDAGQIRVCDLQSTNGIKVNGASVQEHTLQSHDIIQIGEIYIEYLVAGDSPQGQEAVRQENSNEPLPRKRKRLQMVAAAILILAGGFMFAQYAGFLDFRKVTTEVLASTARVELEGLQLAIMRENDLPIFDLSAEGLKEVSMRHIRDHRILSRFSDEIDRFPPHLFQLFLAEPKLIESYIIAGQDPQVLLSGIRSQLSHAIQNDEERKAYTLIEMMKAIQPDHPNIDQVEEEIRDRFRYVQTPEPQELKEEEKEMFVGYMKEYQQSFDMLVEQERFSDAIAQAEIVNERISEVVQQFPHFANYAEPYIADWRARISQAEAILVERREERDRYREMLAEGREILMKARDYMDLGQASNADKQLDQFLARYPEHPDRPIAKDYKSQIEEVVQQTFMAMKREVESFIRTESFQLAWERLYTFMDQVPTFEKAHKVREQLVRATHNQSRQFYNQARVFEFEADDLISAEQYYKRAVETADPRGALAVQAERRYREVLRKKLN